MSSESRNRVVADALFAVQIIGAFLSCSSQFLRSLNDVRGIAIAVFGLSVAYCGFHIWLGAAAHRACATRLAMQAMITYCTWFLLTLAVMGAMIASGKYRWSVQDTAVLCASAAGTIGIGCVCYWKGKTIYDPAVKGLLAMTYKFVPNMFFAWRIFEEGGSGLPWIPLVVGHFTVSIRVALVFLMVREAGWDRNRVWLAISEASNEVSWILVTIVWLSM